MPAVSTRNTGRARRLLFAAAITTGALLVCLAQSKAGVLETPQPAGFSALSATLPIKSPATNACPASAAVAGWIVTNKPGKVS